MQVPFIPKLTVKFSRPGRTDFEMFRKAAREYYPYEILSMLVGEVRPNGQITITRVLDPVVGTKTCVQVPEKKVGKGEIVLGILHTHPDERSDYLSANDHLAGVQQGFLIVGSLRVRGNKKDDRIQVARKPYFLVPHVVNLA